MHYCGTWFRSNAGVSVSLIGARGEVQNAYGLIVMEMKRIVSVRLIVIKYCSHVPLTQTC